MKIYSLFAKIVLPFIYLKKDKKNRNHAIEMDYKNATNGNWIGFIGSTVFIHPNLTTQLQRPMRKQKVLENIHIANTYNYKNQ